jgi:2-iminobutanoate/2-iminopropanoate deaminase
MSWEKEYGYAQAVKVEDTIYLSGQVSHDDRGNIVEIGRLRCDRHTPIFRRCLQYGATI